MRERGWRPCQRLLGVSHGFSSWRLNAYRSTAGHRQASEASLVVWPCLVYKKIVCWWMFVQRYLVHDQELPQRPMTQTPPVIDMDRVASWRKVKLSKCQGRDMVSFGRRLRIVPDIVTSKVLYTRHSRQHAASSPARSSEGPYTSYAIAVGINEQQTTSQILWSHSQARSSTTRSRRDKDPRHPRRDSTSPQSHHGLYSGRQE